MTLRQTLSQAMLAVAAASSLGVPALASCVLTPSPRAELAIPAHEIDPFAPRAGRSYEGSARFVIDARGGPCVGRFYVTGAVLRRGGVAYDGQGGLVLRARLRGRSIVGAEPRAGVRVSLAPGESLALPVMLSVKGRKATSGAHVARARAVLARPGAPELSETFGVKTTIATIAKFAVSAASIDLGDLNRNARGSVRLRYWASTPHRLRVESDNCFTLVQERRRHVGGFGCAGRRGAFAETMPYSARVGDNRIAARSGRRSYEFARPSDTGRRGAALPVVVKTRGAHARRLLAGRYSDTITITILPTIAGSEPAAR